MGRKDAEVVGERHSVGEPDRPVARAKPRFIKKDESVTATSPNFHPILCGGIDCDE